MKLTIKSIIYWEMLKGRPFASFSQSSKNDIDSMLYSIYICTGGISCTESVFKRTLENPKTAMKMYKDFFFLMEIMSQFQYQKRGSETAVKDEAESILHIAAFLIAEGMDAAYVMNEMQMHEIPIFLEAYADKRKEHMENKRMWTYLTILPHLTKPLEGGSSSLVSFPWEEQEAQENKKRQDERDIETFNQFMKKGKGMLKF